MPKFNFNLRNPKASIPTPIYLVIRYQKYRIVYPTGQKIIPHRWDKKKQRKKYVLFNPEMNVREQTPEQKKEYHSVRIFNSRLMDIHSIAERIFYTYVKQNDQEEPEPKEYKLLLDVELEKSRFARKDLFTYLNNFIGDRKKIDMQNGKKQSRGASWRSYEQLQTLLMDYTIHIDATIDFMNIDIDFYYDFADFLRNQKKLLPNTIGKHIKSLKSILNSATENGLNSNMIYKNRLFKVITEKVDSIVLNETEIGLISKIDVSDKKHLKQVRDIFLLSAHTGLGYTDFARIRSVNVSKKQVEIADKSNSYSIVLPTHPDLIHIIDEYKGKTPNDFPSGLSNVQMNAYIKKLCERISQFQDRTEHVVSKRKKGERITYSNVPKYELITMQTARRSFYINQYKQGTDMYILMVISGHKSQDSFLRYINVTPNEHAVNMQKRWKDSLLTESS